MKKTRCGVQIQQSWVHTNRFEHICFHATRDYAEFFLSKLKIANEDCWREDWNVSRTGPYRKCKVLTMKSLV